MQGASAPWQLLLLRLAAGGFEGGAQLAPCSVDRPHTQHVCTFCRSAALEQEGSCGKVSEYINKVGVSVRSAQKLSKLFLGSLQQVAAGRLWRRLGRSPVFLGVHPHGADRPGTQPRTPLPAPSPSLGFSRDSMENSHTTSQQGVCPQHLSPGLGLGLKA